MIKCNIRNFKSVIRSLEREKGKLEKKVHNFIERLGQEGYKVANAKFATALYAGTNDVKVELKWEDDLTLHLIANGDAVAFIEFGTGVIAEPYPKQVEGITPRGQYGKKKGAHPPWFYNGDPGNLGHQKRRRDGTSDPNVVVTWGNPPARAMFDAATKMKWEVRNIAKEVFGK